MIRKGSLMALLPAYIYILCLFLLITVAGTKTLSVFNENQPAVGRSCIVIDPGHGGEDGGTTSCTGVLESHINLEIGMRLDDLLHLLGVKTVIIRTTDRSVHTTGNTIAERKVSDLKERVRIINEIKPVMAVSIHQNYYSDNRYYGPQVFYGHSGKSKAAAEYVQTALNSNLAPQSTRRAKQAEGIFLMKNITSTGILIECGFLSNQQEEAKLRSDEYQKKLCGVISAAIVNYLSLDDKKCG